MVVNPDTLAVLRSRALMDLQQQHKASLQALFDGRPDRSPFYLSGVGVMHTESPRNVSWESWLPDALDRLAVDHAPKAANSAVFRPLVLCWDPHGVHYIDDLFGARVFTLEDGGWQVRPLDAEVGTLAVPDLEASLTWRETRRFAQAFLELDLGAVTLALPTLSSPINIAVNLYGDRFLLALMLTPDAARHDLRIITDVICACHRWFRENVPAERRQCIAATGRMQPPGFGQICGCATQLLSPELYAEALGPCDARILGLYPHGGMIHLCGEHTQHIPTWRAMPELRAVQMNHRAAEDLAAHYSGLRDDQILYVNPCEGMTQARISDITNGGDRTVVVGLPRT